MPRKVSWLVVVRNGDEQLVLGEHQTRKADVSQAQEVKDRNPKAIVLVSKIRFCKV